MNNVCVDYGESKDSENELEKEVKFEIQEITHSQYKQKGVNFYVPFHERLYRFTQNKIKPIIESVF